jgi:hypothetical protein
VDRRKNHGNPGQFKSDDPRRHVAPGNRYAAGLHRRGRDDFITQQLISELNQPVDRRTINGDQKTKYAKMVEAIVDKAMEANPWAVEFVFERVEGKVPSAMRGSVDSVRIEDVLPLLSEEELEVMERVAQHALTLQPKLIRA